MSDVETLRWGDAQTLQFTTPLGLVPLPAPPTSKQLVQAHWRRPITWLVQIYIAPQFAATEAGTFTLTVRSTVGVGSAAGLTMQTPYTLAAPYAAIRDQGMVPAQDLQIDMILTGTSSLGLTTESVVVEAYAAPITDPWAMTELLHVMTQAGPDERMRWMHGQPFQDDPLTYGPRGR